ncbi:MAG TPA: DUF1643 domain-containing protein [Hellea balneolensis]|uniref:DUF1643 domain-containing protein n=1 Tax=Hellea balneolensis TaxID=287478 RepID=A0A7C5QVP5_9PROT|nr:DUF1643 domain-containing protein [Hellea balneolensis]
MVDLLGEKRDAIFSPCRTWRYRLAQIWDESKAPLFWLMLNPSTADELKNDPTVERCERRARMWGYGGSVVYNIFAYRATDPTDMRASPDPVGPDNDKWIAELARQSRDVDVVAGWGEHGAHLERGRNVLEIFKAEQGRLNALKINASGHPAHPLYIAYKCTPFLMDL